MPFRIIRNDITQVKADAIVNTANPKPRIGRGTDSAIYAAAGWEQLLAEREKIGDIHPGQAAWTGAFNLQAKYIIHTVGPVWEGGNHRERDILRSCYAESLELADKLKCRSIAFPLISSGVYGFPKEDALQIALDEISKFLFTHEMKVLLVVLDRKALELSESLVDSIDKYIDEQAAIELEKKEYGWETLKDFHGRAARRRRRDLENQVFGDEAPRPVFDREEILHEIPLPSGFFTENEDEDLDDILKNGEATFQQRLFQLIDASGMDDVTVYKKANIDRKLFSRIRSKKDYKPKKKTALAFAIALELDLPTTEDLLARAEIAFSPSSTFDLIIKYFITQKVYDVYKIDAVLFRYGQPLLGSEE